MSVVTSARSLAPEIEGLAERIEAERRLPLPLVESFTAAGLFRMCVPRALGGLEVDPATLIAVIEAVARADGSAGWCVMIGATTGLVSAYLPLDFAQAIYGDDTVSGGVLAPAGRAIRENDSYRVSGRWPFASGCQHCHWLVGGCVVLEDGRPVITAGGTPEVRTMIFPAEQVEIIDTWDVSGLRGTGSHDIAVNDLVVPRQRSVSLTSESPRHDGPLYRFPAFGLLAIGIAAVALGIARRAIDELTELAGGKTPTGSRRKLAERATVQADVARAEAAIGGARALLLANVEQAWRAAGEGEALSVPQRAALRLAATNATRASADAVDLMYDAGGGTSVYKKNALQRCFRDVHVATQHMMVGPATYELVGRILLGLETDAAQL